jgi:hypothetical protein
MGNRTTTPTFFWNDPSLNDLRKVIAESAFIPCSESRVVVRMFGTTCDLWIPYFAGVDLSNLAIKEAALTASTHILQTESLIKAVRVSFRLFDPPQVANWILQRERCCIISRFHTDQLGSDTDSRKRLLDALQIKPDVEMLENSIRDSDILEAGQTFFASLTRSTADTFIFVEDDVRRLSEADMKKNAVRIATKLMEKEPAIYKVKIAYLSSMRGSGQKMSLCREDIRRFKENLLSLEEAAQTIDVTFDHMSLIS